MEKFNEDVSSVLGTKISYNQDYDPGILVREKRSNNRIVYNIQSPLPFIGVDVWNCYEISFLRENGLPLNAVAKIVYNCNSEYIVESKSLKLYLNSFNMYKIKGEEKKAVNIFKKMVIKDLSNLLNTEVQFQLFFKAQNKKIFDKFENISNIVNLNGCEFSSFKESPNLLKVEREEEKQCLQIKVPLLRSNCKITGQSDWGDLFLHYSGEKRLNLESFAEYIVSFRGENHFHEEVVEMIYKRLFDLLSPRELMVAAAYTRRGGIDINPIRANKEELLEGNLINIKKHCQKMLRQ